MTKPKGEDAAADDQPADSKYQDAMGNPLDPATVEAAIQEEPIPEVPAPRTGTVRLRYLGRTDLIEVGGHQFRPGATADVPIEVAEELLTHPSESFEEVSS